MCVCVCCRAQVRLSSSASINHIHNFTTWVEVDNSIGTDILCLIERNKITPIPMPRSSSKQIVGMVTFLCIK